MFIYPELKSKESIMFILFISLLAITYQSCELLYPFLMTFFASPIVLQNAVIKHTPTPTSTPSHYLEQSTAIERHHTENNSLFVPERCLSRPSTPYIHNPSKLISEL